MELAASTERRPGFQPAPDCMNYLNGQAMRLPTIMVFCACSRCRRFAQYVTAGAEDEYVLGSTTNGP